MKMVAFIPARSGSNRVPDKNVRPLGNAPLLAYSVISAIESGLFDAVLCVTDSDKYAQIAREFGAEVNELRPTEISTSTSPDIEWVKWSVDRLRASGRQFDAFAILRPTSPFRKSATIRRAWNEFLAAQPADSIRAVRQCTEHPGKMWIIGDRVMSPFLPFRNEGVPWHSSQIQTLPRVYVQDASLEIAWTKTLEVFNSISGETVVPFLSEGFEGFDINTENDWKIAESLLERDLVQLPALS